MKWSMSRRDLMKTAAVPEEFRRVDPKEVHKIVDAPGRASTRGRWGCRSCCG
jgi:hypothetical protein